MRLERKEKSIIIMREDNNQVIQPNNYYDSGDLLFDVSNNLLCKACGKNRINIVYL